MAPKSSPRAIAKVIYKPSTQSTDEYTVVVNVEEVRVYCTVIDAFACVDETFSSLCSSTTVGKQEVCGTVIAKISSLY